MPRKAAVVALIAPLIVSGCVAMGWRFGPGFSARNGVLFSEPPVVVHRGADYYLSWTQGTTPFFFEPDYRAMNGRLVFATVATASSGSLAGQHREMRIEGAGNVQALQRGGAVWWESEPEPDGTFVPLKIVEESPAAPSERGNSLSR